LHWVEKLHEGRFGEGRYHHRKRENPGGENTQESYALNPSLNRWIEWRTLSRSNTLRTLKRREGMGAGNSVRMRKWNKALKGCPKSGSGMK
jgi:hypothetical protein